jgi:hypothetical protein
METGLFSTGKIRPVLVASRGFLKEVFARQRENLNL